MTNASDFDGDGRGSTQSSVPTVPGFVPRFAPGAAELMPRGAFPEYEFLRELGRGGMGIVYLARNRALDRLEAIKVVSGPWSEDQFRQEVRAAARLNHPNVVTVYTALSGGPLAFAMEFVEGENLARLVKSRGPLSPARACSCARQAALGLQHAHERGMTHRDVKPQNLMVFRANGRDVLKVLDFGLAKLAEPDLDSVAVLGPILGTPGYASPEQVRNADAADVRSDVYSLGVTLRFLLTGEQPGEDDPSESDALQASWPDGLAAVLAKMTARAPGDRYQTAAEVASALEPFTVPPQEPPTPARPKRRWRAVGAGGALLAIALGVTAIALSGGAPAVPPIGGPTPTALQPVETGFVPLFNGTDLSGWVVDGGDADQWRVEEGALATTGRKNGPQTWLLSQHPYGDMRLRFEYQLEAGGNSGFAFRAVPGERPILAPGGRPTPTAYHQQVELSDDADKEWQWLPTGQVAGGSGPTAPVLKPTSPAKLRLPGEWNAVEIEMVGQALKVTLNGSVIQTADLDRLIAQGSRFPALKRKQGRIGFQQCRYTARFRNIEVLELPK
ncbi:DUF1080 domain-containing protein [Gemmata sp. G18]|uniref:DUF1080 domain-containing protein n=1 Tax=Gemmata palustris TaxID=2822762 RepID=A0ABS5C3Z7_9BACT|nr:family 16 glycoside hydrolase [Gemmata palustris]MBP3960722.1 DUF1080 domain-containing protein [Gemmata palustris]